MKAFSKNITAIEENRKHNTVVTVLFDNRKVTQNLNFSLWEKIKEDKAKITCKLKERNIKEIDERFEVGNWKVEDPVVIEVSWTWVDNLEDEEVSNMGICNLFFKLTVVRMVLIYAPMVVVVEVLVRNPLDSNSLDIVVHPNS